MRTQVHGGKKMKRHFSALPVFLLVFLMASTTEGDAMKMMSVQVKRGEVRATPYFLGKIVATLSYGDRVEVLGSKESWFRVSLKGKDVTGWMHASALSEKRILLKAGETDAQVAASSGELALAGKGFNADVEAEFKARNRNIDFTWIDRMQEMKVPPERIAAFLQEGGLVPAQDGGK
jgi:SH3-like domain-containing protein